MVNILAIAENDEMITLLNTAVEESDGQLSWVRNEIALTKKLLQLQEGLVFLPNSNSYDVYRLCSKIKTKFPLVKVFLVFESEARIDPKSAIKAGATDVIFLSSPHLKVSNDFKTAIQDSLSKNPIVPKEIEAAHKVRVITIASTKGGIGKTSIAVNLAAAFKNKKKNVAIIDLDLQFGDVSLFFDVKPRRTIYDWIKEDDKGTEITSFLTTSNDGISILAAPQRPEFAELITGEDVKRAIKMLKTMYDIVIVDASGYLDENLVVGMENSDDLLVLTHLDLPTLKNSKLLIDTLKSLKLHDRIKVVINKQMKIKGLTEEVAEKILGQEILISLPSIEKEMLTSINEGTPYIYSNERSLFAKKIAQLADLIINPEISTGDKRKRKRG